MTHLSRLVWFVTEPQAIVGYAHCILSSQMISCTSRYDLFNSVSNQVGCCKNKLCDCAEHPVLSGIGIEERALEQ